MRKGYPPPHKIEFRQKAALSKSPETHEDSPGEAEQGLSVYCFILLNPGRSTAILALSNTIQAYSYIKHIIAHGIPNALDMLVGLLYD